MKPAFALGLRGRLLLLLAGVFAVLFALTVWHAIDQRGRHMAIAKTDVIQAARLISAQQAGLVSHAHSLLLTLMRLPQLRPGGLADECHRLLRERAEAETRFSNIGLVQPNGDVVCMATQQAPAINVADRGYFQQALKTRHLVTSGLIASRSTGRPTIVFAQGMRDVEDRVLGVLFIALDLDWLQQALFQATLPERSLLTVVDVAGGSGTVVARYPAAAGLIGTNITDTPLFRTFQKQGGEGTVVEAGLDGVERIHGFAPLLDTIAGRLYLWVGIPMDVVLAPAQRQLIIQISVALVLLLAAMTAVYWGGNRWFLRRVVALAGAAKKLGAGDLTARTGLAPVSDELGRLAGSFDRMAGALQRKEGQLVASNRALRVLSASNQALLRAQDEQGLLDELCRMVVEEGGYRMAWVGYAEQDAQKSVRPMAQFGAPEGYVEELRVSWEETERGRGPTGTAIRDGISVVARHILTDPVYAPWREMALAQGFGSSLALPLKTNGSVFGALNIYAQEPDAFDEQEISLLGEAAADLSFGIAGLRTRAERERMEARAMGAEARFKAAAEASIDAVFILKSMRDAAGRITDFELTDINPRGEEMIAVQREQAMGAKLCELLPAIRTEGWFELYLRVLESGQPLDEEFPIDTPEIKAKWLRQQVVRVGEGVAISWRDVTQWKVVAEQAKLAEEALRDSEERYRMVAETASDIIVVIDQDGRIQFVNSASENMFGYTSAEMIGQSLTMLVPEDLRVAHVEGFKRYIDTGRRTLDWKLVELRARHKSGKEVPVELSLGDYVRDGKHVFSGIIRDITERKAHEMALARTTRALKTLSATNIELVKARDELELLQAVCRIIVEEGGYSMAWIGYAEDDPQKTIAPKAWAGIAEDRLAELKLTWAEAERGQGPMSRAIRSGEPQITRDMLSDPRCALCKELAIEHGYTGNFAFPIVVRGKTIGALCIYTAETDALDAEETRLLEELGNDLSFGIETLRTRAERERIAHAHAHHAQILQKSLEQSIEVVAGTVEARDPYTAGHQRRVCELAVAIAREMGLPEEKIHGIQLAATIHDLGKIRVPAEILAKPGKLTDVEFMLIKVHPQAGYDILKDVDFPWPIADIVLQHHERMDGSGYPQGLKGGQTLLESRIMAVADVVEAMASHRPYRAALGIEAALKEIERGRGSAYDAAVADACRKLFREGRFAFQG